MFSGVMDGRERDIIYRESTEVGRIAEARRLAYVQGAIDERWMLYHRMTKRTIRGRMLKWLLRAFINHRYSETNVPASLGWNVPEFFEKQGITK